MCRWPTEGREEGTINGNSNLGVPPAQDQPSHRMDHTILLKACGADNHRFTGCATDTLLCLAIRLDGAHTAAFVARHRTEWTGWRCGFSHGDRCVGTTLSEAVHGVRESAAMTEGAFSAFPGHTSWHQHSSLFGRSMVMPSRRPKARSACPKGLHERKQADLRRRGQRWGHKRTHGFSSNRGENKVTEVLPSWEVGHCDRGASDAYLSISQIA